MYSPFASLRILTLPGGATTGTRIVIDGINGTITGYGPEDQIIFQFTGDTSVFGDVDGAHVEFLDGEILLYNQSDTLIGTGNADGWTAINPSSGQTAVLSPSAGGSAEPISEESNTTAPGVTDPTPSLTLVGADNLEVRLVAVVPGIAAVATAFSSPALYTERSDISGPTNRAHSTAATRAGMAAGASGIQNFTSTFNFNSAEDWEHGVSVGLVSGVTPASFRSAATATRAGVGTLTVNRPAGTVDGDLMVMHLVCGGPGVGFNPSVMAPVGWTQLETQGSPVDAQATSAVYFRVANSEPSTYDVLSQASPLGTPTCDFLATIITLQNVNTTAVALAGLVLGDDTNLYRSAANTLATDDSMTVGVDLNVVDDLNVGDNTLVGGTLTVNLDANVLQSINAAVSVSSPDGNFSDDVTVGDDVFVGGQVNIGSSTVTTASLAMSTANADSAALITRVGGDTVNRFEMQTDGDMGWGTGSANADVWLYRSATRILQVEDRFTAGQADLQVHGQSVARGLVATPFQATTNNGAHSATTTTDMVLNNVSVVAGRWYAIHVHTQLSLSGTGVWTLNLLVNGSNYDRLWRIDQVDPTVTADATVYWQAPSTQATDDFAVEANEASGTATLTLVGTATVMRWLTMIDVGT